MEKSSPYIYEEAVHNLTAAQILVPYYVQLATPKSVLDVGCGLGDFLYAFTQQGISDITGIDGEWVPEDKLFIEHINFVRQDLRESFHLGRKFDLVLCQEVAEHLPESSADQFIASLTSHSDTIIFSAAIPNQGGQNHLNEQSFGYWQQKFEQHGFRYYDVIRPAFWSNGQVPWWYTQNLFLVAKENSEAVSRNNLVPVSTTGLQVHVHPGLLLAYQVHCTGLQKEMEELENKYNSVLSGRYRWSTYGKIIINKVKNLLS